MKKIWLLIHVHRGFIEEPEIFYDEQTAMKRKAFLLKEINQDYDEIKVYEKYV
jgi:hypothetical protein